MFSHIPSEVRFSQTAVFVFWAIIPELNNKALRVVTLEDAETIHNAFPDSNFKL